ncbi:hypothetical protein AYI69_g3895 [Smittium culicis]|uniref:Uncharacterized protein n=1 Tax=Smittium culicis TaxID=133412 RepID=A0A1R1YIG3_9FUNG|nr:hypothetical protein AYI69_g3895 [Smittium culicis]
MTNIVGVDPLQWLIQDSLLPLQSTNDNNTCFDNTASCNSFDDNNRSTFEFFLKTTGWTSSRLHIAIDTLMRDGVLWIDYQSQSPTYYATMFFF